MYSFLCTLLTWCSGMAKTSKLKRRQLKIQIQDRIRELLGNYAMYSSSATLIVIDTSCHHQGFEAQMQYNHFERDIIMYASQATSADGNVNCQVDLHRLTLGLRTPACPHDGGAFLCLQTTRESDICESMENQNRRGIA